MNRSHCTGVRSVEQPVDRCKLRSRRGQGGDGRDGAEQELRVRDRRVHRLCVEVGVLVAEHLAADLQIKMRIGYGIGLQAPIRTQ